MLHTELTYHYNEKTVDDRGQVWVKVTTKDGVEGWISTKYTDRNETVKVEKPAPVEKKGVYAEGGNVNIRAEATKKSKDIGTVKKGKSVQICMYLGKPVIKYDERGVAWYKITDGEVTGWVSSMYATLYM